MVVLAACAMVQQPAGRDFAKAAFARFALDQTSLNEAEAALGPPMKQVAIRGIARPGAAGVVPGTPIALVRLNYYYAPFGFGTPAGQHPAKSATLVFLNERLVAYDFNTAIPAEVTPPIDQSVLANLRQGATTRAEAIALLGTPNGELLHVLNDAQRGASQVSYGWRRIANGTVEQRSLLLFFDKASRLSTYTLLDNSYPVDSPPIPMPMPVQPPTPVVPVPHREIPQPDLSHT
jgi:hypothetical protein